MDNCWNEEGVFENAVDDLEAQGEKDDEDREESGFADKTDAEWAAEKERRRWKKDRELEEKERRDRELEERERSGFADKTDAEWAAEKERRREKRHGIHRDEDDSNW
jgi:hypothetical protein